MVEPLVQLGQQYKTEFEDKYEGIRKRGAEQIQQAQDTIQQIQPQIESKQQEIVALLQDTADAPTGYAKPILEIFAWTSVIVFAAYFASLVTGLILAPIIGLFVGSAMAFIIAYVGLPAAAYYYADYSQADNEVRFNLLTFAVAEGVLTGFLFADRYMSTIQPLPFVTPILIAVVGSLAEDKIGNSRVPLLGATVGLSAAFHILFGIVARQLSIGYLVMVVAHSIAGLAAIQLVLKEDFSFIYSSGKAYVTMFTYLMAILYVQMVVLTVFGGPKESMQQASADEPPPPPRK